MKSILITGIDGFVGTYLKDLLFEKYPDADIVGITNKPVNQFSNSKITYYQCDILDFNSMSHFIEKIQPDLVFHLAGIAFVPDAESNPSIALNVNGIGSFNLFEAVSRYVPSSKIITISSSNVYEKKVRSVPILETEIIKPHNIYGLSKSTMEDFARYFIKERNLNIVIMRSFNHFGPGQSPKFVFSDFGQQIAKIELNEQDNKIFVGDLSAIRDFTDVRDIVYGYYLAAKKGKTGEVYNLCSGQGHSIEDMLTLLIGCSQTKVQIVQDANKVRKLEIPVLIGSHQKFTNDTGWVPAINVKDTLIDVLNYWRKQIKIHD